MGERTTAVLSLVALGLAGASIAGGLTYTPKRFRLKTITVEEMAAYMPAQLVLEKGRRGYIVVSSCVAFRQVQWLPWLPTQSKKLLYFKRRDDALDPCLLIEAGHRRDDGIIEIARIEAEYIAEVKTTALVTRKVTIPSPQTTMALDFALQGTGLEAADWYPREGA